MGQEQNDGQNFPLWQEINALALNKIQANNVDVSGIQSDDLYALLPILKTQTMQREQEIIETYETRQKARIDAHDLEHYFMTERRKKTYDRNLKAYANATGQQSTKDVERNIAEIHEVPEAAQIVYETKMYDLLGGASEYELRLRPLLSKLFPKAEQAQGKWSMGKYLG